MKLLIENIDSQNLKSQILEEDDQFGEKVKNCYITGPFIVTEQRNKNGRVYDSDGMEREVNKYLTEKVKLNRAGGELNHPDSPIINLERISHYITELKREGNVWVGKAKIANTPMGTIAKSLIKDGYQLGVSTRGLGEVSEDGTVGNNYMLVTVDLVSEPSNRDAYVNAINESKSYVVDSKGLITEKKIEAFDKKLENLPLKGREEYITEAITNFIKSLK